MKIKWTVISLLCLGFLWSAAFVGYFVGRHDAVVEQARLDIQTLVGCATLIREGNAPRALPYIESRISANASLLQEYAGFSEMAWVGFKQLCNSVSGTSIKFNPLPTLAAYSVDYPDNQLGDKTHDFLKSAIREH